MAVKQFNGDWLWKRLETAAGDAYVGVEDEVVVDIRGTDPVAKVCDGLTPGGLPIAAPLVGVRTPTILYPQDGAVDIHTEPLVSASPFIGFKTNFTQDAHTASYWEIATDFAFTALVYQSPRMEDELQVLNIRDGDPTLSPNTTYYMRVRYVGQDGDASSWSPVSQFTTRPGVTSDLTEFLVPGTEQDSHAGREVAISPDGNTIAVGIRYPSTNTDAVVIYTRDGDDWSVSETLNNGDGTQNDNFGSRLAFSGDGQTLAVGSIDRLINTNHGTVRLYRLVGGVWTFQDEITGSLTAGGGNQRLLIGNNTIALNYDGSVIAVGASLTVVSGGVRIGVVYIFEESTPNTWTETNYLTGSLTEDNSRFGISVDISPAGDVVVVGTRYRVINGEGSGCVYVFEQSGGSWTEAHVLGPSDGGYNDFFGGDVSLTDDLQYLAVGSSRNTTTLSQEGAVYIFEDIDGTWTQIQKLLASDTMTSSNGLGTDVRFSGDGHYLIAAANSYNDGKGQLYVFAKMAEGWTEITKLTLTNNPATNDYFGGSIDIASDYTIVAGAVARDDWSGGSYTDGGSFAVIG